MDERVLYAVGGAIAGALAGGAATYFLTIKKLDKEYEKALDEELSATKKFFTNLQKVDYPTPGDLARERGIQITETEILIEELQYGGEEQERDEVEEAMLEEMSEVSRNVFTNFANTETWDADKEEAARDTSKPYVISHDEFFENEPDYIQTQLTWFAEDGVLADREDKPADEALVGEENLERFGHGSKDPNIVYVRNEAMGLDFEILYAEGKYSEQVMGYIQHDDGPRRFRLTDER